MISYNALPKEEKKNVQKFAMDYPNTSARNLSAIIADKMQVNISHVTISAWKKKPPRDTRIAIQQSFPMEPINYTPLSKEQIETFLEADKQELEESLEDFPTTGEKLMAITESRVIRSELLSRRVDTQLYRYITRINEGELLKADELEHFKELIKFNKSLASTIGHILKASEVAEITNQVNDEQLEMFEDPEDVPDFKRQPNWKVRDA